MVGPPLSEVDRIPTRVPSDSLNRPGNRGDSRDRD